MSGWNDFASLATQTLKNAQKKIDKVLEIEADEDQTDASTQDNQDSMSTLGLSNAASNLTSWFSDNEKSWGLWPLQKDDENDLPSGSNVDEKLCVVTEDSESSAETIQEEPTPTLGTGSEFTSLGLVAPFEKEWSENSENLNSTLLNVRLQILEVSPEPLEKIATTDDKVSQDFLEDFKNTDSAKVDASQSVESTTKTVTEVVESICEQIANYEIEENDFKLSKESMQSERPLKRLSSDRQSIKDFDKTLSDIALSDEECRQHIDLHECNTQTTSSPEEHHSPSNDVLSDDLDSISIIRSVDISPPASSVYSAKDHQQHLEKKKQQEILEAREAKLLHIATINASLHEENNVLKTTYSEVLSKLQQKNDEIKALKLSLTKAEEKSVAIKKQFNESTRDADTGTKIVQNLQRQVEEKDEQITQLVLEGERLSKQELKLTQNNKKVNEKLKEHAKTIETYKSKLKEIDSLKEKLREKREQEIKYDEIVNNMKSQVDRQEKQLKAKQSQIDAMMQSATQHQNQMENSYKQITELHTELSQYKSELEMLQTTVQSSRETDMQELSNKWQMEKASILSDFEYRIRELETELAQERSDAERKQKQHNWDIEQLNKRLNDADFRNEELSTTVGNATQPLMRQMETLRQSQQQQQANWQRYEAELTLRLTECQNELSSEREKLAQISNQQHKTQCDLASERARSNTLQAQLDAANEHRQKLQHAQNNIDATKTKYASEIERLRTDHVYEISEARKEHEELVSQYKFEANQRLKETECERNELKHEIDRLQKHITSLQQKITDINENKTNKLSIGHQRKSSVYGDDDIITLSNRDNLANLIGSTSDGIVEQLRERLQQRSSEILIQQEEIVALKQTREQLASHLSTARRQLDEQQARCDNFEQLNKAYQCLNEQHQTLLALYGEKLELIEELQMDLHDIRQLMKQQAENLSAQ